MSSGGSPARDRRRLEEHLFGRAARRDTETLIASARWSDPDKLKLAAQRPERPFYFGPKRDPGTVFLGVVGADGDQPQKGIPVGWRDNRHLVTVAGSRAGKGQSAIIPNLHLYAGSIVCIDPKGENAQATAAVRASWHGQDVFVLDPFGVSGVTPALLASFNPLEALDPQAPEMTEDVRLLADSLVVVSDERHAHWDESARGLLEALILFVLCDARIPNHERSLVKVRQLLMGGAPGAARKRRVSELAYSTGVWFPPAVLQDHDLDGFDALLQELAGFQHPLFGAIVSGQAAALKTMAPEELASVLSVARRNTKFIDGTLMARVLSGTGRRFDFASLKSTARGTTLYIVLPARFMSTHARWVRVLVNCLIVSVERSGPLAKDRHPVLAILDEFPVLQHMQLIETAVGYMAGYGLKLWSIVQDLGQIKRHYPASWETFLGNAGVRQFFGNIDDTTLAYVSKQLGETEVEVTSYNESMARNTTTNAPSAADRERLLRQQSAAGSIDDTSFFQSSSEQVGKTEGRSSELRKSALLNADEIARLFSRESGNQLLLIAGQHPVRLQRVEHYRLGTGAAAYWRSLLS